MCTLYENIILLCKKKGVSGGKMCLDVGISKSTLSDLKMGRKSGISLPTATKIADYFGVSVEYLTTGVAPENEKKPATPKDDELNKEFADIFNKLTDDEKKLVRAQILGILQNRE